jgi:hypothetical protein
MARHEQVFECAGWNIKTLDQPGDWRGWGHGKCNDVYDAPKNVEKDGKHQGGENPRETSVQFHNPYHPPLSREEPTVCKPLIGAVI